MRHRGALFLCGLLALGPICLAQVDATGSAPASPPAVATRPGADVPGAIPRGTLGAEYLDGSFGFAVRPLAGATIDRRKRAVEGRVQLAQFVRLDIAWSMAIRIWATTRPLDVIAAKEALSADLGAQYPDLKITLAEPDRIAARDAVRLVAAFSADGRLWLRQQAAVAVRPDHYLLLILTTPADDRQVAEEAFAGILKSFRIARTEQQQQQLDAALERGGTLEQAVGAARKPLSDLAFDQPVLLRLSRNGQGIGLVEIRERAAKLGHKDGLRILQQAWLFNPDESVQFMEEDKFIANDLSYDEWRNVSQVMPSRQVDSRQRLLVSVEGGIRRGDKLVIESIQAGSSEKQTKAIEVERSYAPAAWPLVMPRLVDLKTPELYAYSMYDTERRGLVLRAFRVAGPAQVTVAGRRVSAYRIEDSEGGLPPVGEMDVDEAGRLLRLSSGAVEMVVSTQAQIDQEFAEKVRAVRETFRKNAGLPSLDAKPPPAPRQAGPGNSSGASPGRSGTPGRASGQGIRRPAAPPRNDRPAR